MNGSIKKSRLKIQNYIVYGDHDTSVSPFHVHFQWMDTTARKHGYDIKPHVHSNLLQLHLLEKGKTIYTINDTTIELTEPTIIAIPENTLHSGKENENNDSFDRIFEAGRQLNDELQNNNIGKEVKVRSIAGAILIDILRLGYSQANSNVQLKNNRYYKYFIEFQKAIKREYSGKKKIKDYALELQITPTHLNRICHSITGKSAFQVVQDYIILEAKRYLIYSSYTVSEIAHLLDFSDGSYFIRYFKKSTEMTPNSFRKQEDKSLNSKI